MPKFIIDGNELEFKPGQTIIQAAADHGIDIPHFCWHPSLSVSGNCRVCLVEVEKFPKPQIACSTQVMEGMVVHTTTDKAVSVRNAVMEFILVNHPLDCPICDEAGECKLQDYAFKHSTGESRFTEEKQHKDKRVALGPNVMFDGERCISCSRCIRFCDEIAKDNELTFVQRGDRVTITTFPGKELDNPYAMNVVDICPVGALTNKDFRFQARVWDMGSTKTICNGCSRGCNIDVWTRNNEILRLTPRQNDDVNSYWMCDHGRLNTFKNVNSDTRVDGAYIKRDGKLVKADWAEVFAAAASELKTYREDEIAFIGSAHATCEDNYAFAKLAQSVVGTHNIDFPRITNPSFGDDILRKSDMTPNALGAYYSGVVPGKKGLAFEQIMEEVDRRKIKVLYILEEDIAALNKTYGDALAKLEYCIVHAVNFNETTKYANIVFGASSYAEKNGTFVNFNGRVQRIRPSVLTVDGEMSLDGKNLSRLDKFGTTFDRWGKMPKTDARPSWKILSSVATAAGKKMNFGMAEDVFNDLAKHTDAFHGLDYDKIGEQGAQLPVKQLATV